jgi:UDP-2,3-diacylglucosamine pyrophosphatase LpxH
MKIKLFVFFSILQISLNAWGHPFDPQFLAISDIHFNPLTACEHQAVPCDTLQKLEKHDVSDWGRILGADDISKPTRGNDTNYSLLQSTIRAASRTELANPQQFIILLGDMLPHQFRELFIKYSGDSSAQGYSAFAVKTMQYVAYEFKTHLQYTSVYFVPGNHDVDEDRDYVPSSFFEKITTAWQDLIKDPKVKNQFQQQFPHAGYYAIDLDDFELIVLNSNLFSTDITEKSVIVTARAELFWLRNKLKEAAIKHRKVIIAGHKPMAIDVNASLESTPIKINALWKKEFSDTFLNILNQYPDVVAGVVMGHLHIDGFELIHLNNHKNIPMIQIPAISPIYFNQPGLKLILYDTSTLQLSNMQTALYKMHDATDEFEWVEEYDFNEIYQPDCVKCTLVEGMQRLNATNELAKSYQKFYAVSEDAMPITKGFWSPYYWCATQAFTAEDYKQCIE